MTSDQRDFEVQGDHQVCMIRKITGNFGKKQGPVITAFFNNAIGVKEMAIDVKAAFTGMLMAKIWRESRINFAFIEFSCWRVQGRNADDLQGARWSIFEVPVIPVRRCAGHRCHHQQQCLTSFHLI